MLSATAGVEDVVRMGWLLEAIACRKQSNASDDVPFDAIVMCLLLIWLSPFVVCRIKRASNRQ